MTDIPGIRPVQFPNWLVTLFVAMEIVLAILFLRLFSQVFQSTQASRAEQALSTQIQRAAQATTTQIAYEQTEESSLIATQTALAPTITPTPTATATSTATPTPIATPKPGFKKKSEIDGMAHVYIPAGTFLMSAEGQPKKKITLDAYWISLTQVTNAMYRKCVEAGGCENPIRKEINPHYYNPKYASHPAVYIVWEKAQAYCLWSGGRLPTEAEWVRAASGDGTRKYAWGGADPDPNLVNVDLFHGDHTMEVGKLSAGASPYGALDMGGNVREWVADWYRPNYFANASTKNPTGPKTGDMKVLRGAAWGDPPEKSSVSTRFAHVPDSPGANRGFRCAYDE